MNSAKQLFLLTNKINQKDFYKLVDIDITPTKKYLEKMCLWFVQKNATIQQLEHTIHLYNTLCNKNIFAGKQKDISSFKTFQELSELVEANSGKSSMRQQKIQTKLNESKKIFENEKYLVIQPLSENASCQYGSGTKWCISSIKNENLWNQYIMDDLVRFYFVFDKTLNDSNPLYKIAVTVYPNKKIETYNAKNEKINFKNYLKQTGLNSEIFVYNEYTQKEIEENQQRQEQEIRNKISKGEKIDWKRISIYQKLSENFIREFKDKVDWNYISAYQKLSEDFIREFQDKVNWVCISWYQILSKDFIREFQDKTSWFYISKYQNLSKNLKIKLIGTIFQQIKYFQRILLENLKIKLIGILFQQIQK